MEYQQAVVRIAVVATILSSFYATSLQGSPLYSRNSWNFSTLIGSYLAVSIAYLIWIAGAPGRHVVRRVITITTDQVCVGLTLLGGDSVGLSIYPIFLWISIGNGIRFGVAYLAYAVLISVVSFLPAAFKVPLLRDNPVMSLGLLIGLIAVPFYTATLLSKLAATTRLADSANRAKSHLLAIVSHELRTPLNAVVGMTELIRATPLNDDQKDMFLTVETASKTLMETIDLVLNFSRVEAGQIRIAPNDVDLHAALAEIDTLMRPAAREKGLLFSVTLDANLPAVVYLDWGHTRQILINLISNALKFTNEGRIEVTARKTEDEIQIAVTDSGIGIAPARLKEIFEPFSQADDSIQRRYGGSGLGLTVSRDLAAAMSGTIQVESIPGQGSRFTISLPLVLTNKPVSTLDPLPINVIAFGHGHPQLGDLAVSVDRPETLANVLTCFRLAGPMKPAVLLLSPTAGHVVFEAASAALALQIPVIVAGVIPHLPSPPLVTLDMDPHPDVLRQALRIALAFATRGAVSDVAAPRLIRSLSVLVAEDSRVNIKVVQRILENAGHAVRVATTGDQMLDALEQSVFDAVVADINMPGTSVIDVVKLYRIANLDRPHMPIIALSADTSEATRRECEAAGFDFYLTKPVVGANVLATLERFVASEEITPADNIVPLTRHSPLTHETLSAVDRTVIQTLHDLGDSLFVAKLVREFIEDAENIFAEMASAVAEGGEQFQTSTHSLRSAAFNIGARSIARLCYESAPRTETQRDRQEFCQTLRTELARFRQEIAPLLEGQTL